MMDGYDEGMLEPEFRAAALRERIVLGTRETDYVRLHGAMHPAQEFGLVPRLNSLGHGEHADGIGHIDHGLDDRALVQVRIQAADEGAVDLQLVKRQGGQVAEVRVARSR